MIWNSHYWGGLCLVLLVPVACTGAARPIDAYLTGFQLPPAKEAVRLPLVVGVLIALPEEELSRPTTPSKASLERLGLRIQKQLQESPQIKVERIFPPIIVPATGLGTVSLDMVREATQAGPPHVIVIVATSQPARKVQYGRVEDQLFAKMDAALVDLPTGRVLAEEGGQDDYVLAQSYDYNIFSYPRLYYRTFTFAGPFTVVEGDPYKALGEAAFSGAADQIGMKLRQLLDPRLGS